MMNVGVQTDDVNEEELDWDLSDNVDRETQTLPPNPTPFQLNRSDAFVQTDYRYLPLAVSRPPTSRVPIKLVDASTQTEHNTTSVSTQTEEPYLLPYLPLSQAANMCFPPLPEGLEGGLQAVHHTDASSGPSTSGLGSALQRQPILQPLPGTLQQDSTLDMLPLSPPPSPEHPLSRPFDIPPLGRGNAEERWSRLAQLGLDDFGHVGIRAPPKTPRTRRRMVDVSIQTDNDILTDEAPEFAARPPPCRKVVLLENVDFTDLDVHVLTTPETVTRDTAELIKYLCRPAKDDLQRLRVIFRWVTENIRYDWKYVDKYQSVEDILQTKAGVGKDYVAIMVELCHLAGIRIKKIHGFARPHDFRVGRIFDPERDPLHTWTAVFLFGSWRLIDPTWSAGYMDAQGKYHPHLQEHFFLTDPDHLVYTHFPYHKLEMKYSRWQLLDNTVTLEQFNAMPKVMPEFWDCKLKLNRPKTSPITFKIQTEITLASSSLIRYKYKFFLADEDEETSINQWVFCTMKENNALGSFVVQPPEANQYLLKIYAGLEDLLEDEGSALPHVVTFLLICEKARRHPIPWPLHDVAWGPTPRLYECGLDPISQPDAIITTWGGKRQLFFDKAFDILSMFQIYDSAGQILDLKGILGRDETEEQLRLIIVPPGTGFYKLLIYGIPRPQVRGRWRLPLLASYLIECKMTLDSKSPDPQVAAEKKKTKKKIKPNIRR